MPHVSSSYSVERIVSAESGSGSPAILMLHGWGGDERTLASLAAPFSAHRRVFRIALPGFGSSPEPPEPWGSAEYASAVADWMTRKGLTGADVVGHSHGGRAAIRLAAERPGLVKSLVLIGSAGLRGNRSIAVSLKLAYSRVLRSIAGLAGGRVAEAVKARRERLGSPDWKAATPLMRATLSRVLQEDLSEQARAITAPTLLIWGENDSATPVWMGKKLAQLISSSRIHIIEGAGHYVFLDRPGEVTSLIWDHLGLPKAW